MGRTEALHLTDERSAAPTPQERNPREERNPRAGVRPKVAACGVAPAQEDILLDGRGNPTCRPCQARASVAVGDAHLRWWTMVEGRPHPRDLCGRGRRRRVALAARRRAVLRISP